MHGPISFGQIDFPRDPMTDYLSRLIAHMRWADRIVADALEADPPPDAEAVRLFAHVASVEHLWYSRILGHSTKSSGVAAAVAVRSRALSRPSLPTCSSE